MQPSATTLAAVKTWTSGTMMSTFTPKQYASRAASRSVRTANLHTFRAATHTQISKKTFMPNEVRTIEETIYAASLVFYEPARKAELANGRFSLGFVLLVRCCSAERILPNTCRKSIQRSDLVHESGLRQRGQHWDQP